MIKVGIIGLGYWGPNLVRNFASLLDCSVVGCADLDQGRLDRTKTLYPDIYTTTDYKTLLPLVDAVIIATPIKSHFPLAKEFLESDKHVLIEKPITSTSTQAQELIDLAAQKKLTLMADHTFLYSDNINKIKELVSSGELGRIYNINMIRVNLGLFNKDYNVIWDLAPHDLSILLYMFNKKPTSVIATGEGFVQNGIVENAHLYFRFDDGSAATLYLSWLAPRKIRTMTIVGSKKMLEYDDTATENKIRLYDKGVSLEPQKIPTMAHYETFEQFQYVYRQGEQESINLTEREPLFVMAEHFIQSILEHSTPRTNGMEAKKIVEIIEAAQSSLAKGGVEVAIA